MAGRISRCRDSKPLGQAIGGGVSPLAVHRRDGLPLWGGGRLGSKGPASLEPRQLVGPGPRNAADHPILGTQRDHPGPYVALRARILAPRSVPGLALRAHPGLPNIALRAGLLLRFRVQAPSVTPALHYRPVGNGPGEGGAHARYGRPRRASSKVPPLLAEPRMTWPAGCSPRQPRGLWTLTYCLPSPEVPWPDRAGFSPQATNNHGIGYLGRPPAPSPQARA
jgi:hypothetical protein